MKVLIMDDDEIFCRFIQKTLSRLGYEVEIAYDGVKAIELYKTAKESGHPFDIIIMDLTIPEGMDGKETIKRLLKIDPSVKAIVSSGYANDPIMANYREYGFKGVIAKPYTIEELSNALNRVLTGTE